MKPSLSRTLLLAAGAAAAWLPAHAATFSPSSLSYSFAPTDAPADRTVTVTNTGATTLTGDLFATQTGQPAGALSAFAAATQPAPNLAQVYSAQALSAEFATDRVIVAFKDGSTDFASTAAFDASAGGRELAVARFPGTGERAHRGRRMWMHHLRRHSRQAVLDAIAAMRQDPNVAYVQPDYILHALDVPNDPGFGQQYHLQNSGQTGGTPGADIHATAGWSKQKSAKKIVIGLIDTGIDYLHPDLADNVWTNPKEIPGNGIDDDGNGFVDDVHGWDFVNNDNDPVDDNMHGTHCAGIIAAEGNNNLGVTGVAWQAQIMALKFLDANGSGSTSAAINAINYAKAMGVKVLSNSWGGGSYDQALSDAIAGSGAVFVAAAGNNSANNDVTPQYPAGYALGNIISVAATDANDQIASFSNYGATTVHVAAPGVAIYSTTPHAQTLAMISNNVPAMYALLSGTSMATPIVSGMAGLILDRNGNLSPADVKNIIMNSTDAVPSMSGKCVTGGRVDLDRALNITPAAWLTVTPATVSIAPGSSTSITVHANPAKLEAGAWTGQVALRVAGSADQVLPVTMNISSCVSISGPASVDFGTGWTGYATPASMRLTNSCNSPLVISSINSSHPAFSATSSLPFTVAPFGYGDIALKMQSATAGSFTGNLTVASNAGNAPSLVIPVKGTELSPPHLSVSPASLSGTAVAGAAATATLSIQNTGVSDLSVNLSTATADGGTWLTTAPSVLTVHGGASANVNVTLSAVNLLGGTYTGAVNIAHNDPGTANPYSVPVTFTVTGTKKLSVSPASISFNLPANDRNAPFTVKSLSTSFPLYDNARLADMDGDGDLDLVVCNENYRGNQPTIMWLENPNNHTTNWTPHTVVSKNITSNYFYEDIQPVDLDKDGDMDVAAVVGIPFNAGFVVWFEKTASGYVEHTIASDIQYGASIKAADVDGDGDIDLVTASSTDKKIAWYENDGHQNFTEHVISTNAANAFEVDIADVDGDGKLDIVSASYDDGKYAWYHNNGDRTFTEHFIATVEGAQHAVFADLDKDGDKDIVYSSLTGGAGWFENDGHGNFTQHQLFAASSTVWFYTVRVADMDNDGDLDIVIGNRNDTNYYTTWFENDGHQNFTTAHVIAPLLDRGFQVGDLDGDGDMDIAGGQGVEPASLPGMTMYMIESAYATNAGFAQLTNSGTAPTTVSALTLGSNRFTTTAHLPLVVPPQNSISVGVIYNLNSGSKTSTLGITSDASDNPSLSVALNGVDPGVSLPGRVQAEDYKAGGEGVGYHDLTAGNTGGKYRTDDVDIEATTDVGGGYNVGWTQTGEWLAYDVNVASTGLYNFTARLASGATGTKSINVTIDGTVVASFSTTDASGWQSWKDVTVNNVGLTAGSHQMRINITASSQNLNINYIDVTASSATLINLPGRIQAEDYKVGGEGVGYHDLTAGNTGGVYRTDNVDIEATTDVGGGYNVGWIDAGEWLAYDVKVAGSGLYTLTLRMASANAGTKTAAVTVDGATVATFNTTDASGWQSWKNVVVSNVNLAAGTHLLRINMTTGGFNLNYLDVAAKVNQAPVANAGPDQSVTVNTQVTLDGRGSSDPDNYPQALTYSWSQVSGPAATLAGAAASQPTFTPAAAGTYVFRLTVSDGALSATDDISVTANAVVSGIALPGRIQAEDYKAGGEGVGYHDLSPGNAGGKYRTDNVDIEATTDVGGGYNVGWTQTGEWLAYDVSVANAGLYNFTARLASGAAGTKSINVTVDGNVVASFTYTDASGWQSWKDVTVNNVALNAGTHLLRINFTQANQDLNINYLDVTPSSAPLINLPGRVQAEDYKGGGEGVGYHDLTAGNNGGVYRSDNVDIEATTDVGGGYNVGWIDAGEWLAYDVKVTASGTYAFTMRMASANAGTKTATVTIDGTTVGTFNTTDASGWQSWKDVTVSGVNLSAGVHALRINMTTGGFNVNYLDVH